MIKPVVHSTIRVPSRWQCFYNKPRNINVFTNGEMIKPPIKFLIPRFTLKNWNCVLALINEKMLLRSGGINRLYTLDGRAVESSDGLEDNHFYVAVGREKFKPLPYWCSSRSEKPRVRKSSSRPPIKSTKSAKIEDEKAQILMTDTDFDDKSKKESLERTSDLALAKAPSIFRADEPREEVQGAEEVQDDKNVKVEVPIDQIPAEIVQEEEITAPSSNAVDEVEADALADSEELPEKSAQAAAPGCVRRPVSRVRPALRVPPGTAVRVPMCWEELRDVSGGIAGCVGRNCGMCQEELQDVSVGIAGCVGRNCGMFREELRDVSGGI
ncbi:PREDICTED: doublecortin domain-containing protein 2C [Tinamus guttatus]|uniref:doublecortin domain-containing protein 2C n=1 Tax=Tinamus guttatus TaxID=94827 RepID=UPI00052F2A4A|nr:PREDICTED: doublecortin domain-containing protein 2C [Tinamus guttatus]